MDNYKGTRSAALCSGCADSYVSSLLLYDAPVGRYEAELFARDLMLVNKKLDHLLLAVDGLRKKIKRRKKGA